MKQNYRDRMMQARDPRFAKIAGKIYGTRMLAAEPVEKPKPLPAMDEIATLRAEYERVIGKRPFMGWDEATLRAKIAEAKG